MERIGPYAPTKELIMYFEAEVNGAKYAITVREDRTNWCVKIKKEDGDWEQHCIPKTDYQYLDKTISFLYKNSSYLIDVIGEDTDYYIYTRGSYRNLKIYNDEMLLHESLKSGGNLQHENDLKAGMPGKIVKVFVKPGDSVSEGDPLLIMEAMKMENEMRATKETVVQKVHIKAGENVESGAQLISFEA